jgi:hypothetical protein
MHGLEEIFGTLLLVVFCFLVSLWEKSRYGTIISPFGTLAWPYAVVIALVNFTGGTIGFYSVSLLSTLFIIVGLAFFRVGGSCAALIPLKERRLDENVTDGHQALEAVFGFYRPLFVFLACVSIVAGVIHFHRAISDLGWIGIAGIRFEEAYGKGVLAHIMLWSRPAFFFLFADYLLTKRKTHLIFLWIIFIQVLVLQIKYHIAVLLLGSVYLGFLLGILKLNFKKIIVYACLVYLLFNITYVVGFSRIGLEYSYSPKVQFFLFNHFFTYLYGGVIGFSELLRDASVPIYSFKEIFAVPLNLYRFAVGHSDLVSVIVHHWVSVSRNYQYFHSTNVFGLFGTLYYFIGTHATFIIGFFLGLVTYFFRRLHIRRDAFLGIHLTYAYLLGFMTVSFFNFFFCIIDVYEVFFYLLAFPFLYRFFRRGVYYLRRFTSIPVDA